VPRRTVCISNATGAEGETIGPGGCAQRLGLRYVDEEIIEQAAEEADLDPAFVASAERRKGFDGPREDVLRVPVTASPGTRARRVAAAGDLDEQKAAAVVADEDAARAAYLKRFYSVEREAPTHYDVVVNTDTVPPEKAVELVVLGAS